MTPRLLAGRYRMESLLGTGGMAAVWRAHDERLDRMVAVKELTGDGLGHPKALERFEREARTVARLAHPNIVAVHDFGAEHGDPYLVMELVEGRTVAELLADGPLPVGEALGIALQACDGLIAAHAAGIVHRDVKPSNLLVTPSGVVKIFDFGIARLLDGATDPGLTSPSLALGTATYMAPEQIDNGGIDVRTDLYALGCTLYEMLAGSPPFGGGTPMHVAYLHMTEPPPSVRQARPEVPADLDDLVVRLLAKDPADRPTDAAQVRDRLVTLAARYPSGAPGVGGVDLFGAALAGTDADAGADPMAPADPADPHDPAARDDPAVLAGPAALAGSAVLAGPAALFDPADPAALSDPATLSDPVAVSDPAAPRWRRRVRRGVLLLPVALLAAIGLVLLGTVLNPGDGDPVVTAPAPTTSTTATPPGASPSATPSAVASSAAPSPRPTSRAPRPSPRPSDPIVAMRLSIQSQVAAGNLSADSAHDLSHTLDDLAKAIATGNEGDQQKKLKALGDKLSSLLKDGRLTAAGYTVLKADYDRLAAAVNA